MITNDIIVPIVMFAVYLASGLFGYLMGRQNTLLKINEIVSTDLPKLLKLKSNLKRRIRYYKKYYSR